MAVRVPFRTVAAYAHPGTGGFGAGVVGEIFGFDRGHRGLPRFDFGFCTLRPGLVPTDTGAVLYVAEGLERVARADLVVVQAWPGPDEPVPVELVDAVRAAYQRGAIVTAYCTGVVVLAAAGLLEGRRATTHWRWAGAVAERFPGITLTPEVLYVDEGRILTGAGAAAGIDLYLYLLRREYGAAVAGAVARDMVVPPHRDGGQAQYVAVPMPDGAGDDRLADTLTWARAHLHRRLTVPELAARALMSPRSFARRFKEVTGTTPHAWLLSQRLHRAEELLEGSDLPVEEVARRVGFGTAAALREQFVRRRGLPPRAYRRTFAGR